jgi:phosphatidylglycerophosphatase A
MTALGVANATAAGAGYFPFAPGTVGSAVGVAVYVLMRSAPLGVQFAALLAVVVVGTWAGSVAARHFGREDPGHVVIDEVAGQWLTLIATGAAGWGVVAGFALFRILDIVKPWPARRFERFPAGYGIMADDLMAGVYGHIALRLAGMAAPAVFALFA